MTVLTTSLDRGSEAFAANAAAIRTLVADLREKMAAIREGGGEEARRRHLARGKLLPCGRVRAARSGFAVSRILAARRFGVHEGEVPATCTGRIMRKECVVIANDDGQGRGVHFPVTVKKASAHRRSPPKNASPASISSIPAVFLPAQDEVSPDGEHFVSIFYNQARLSAAGSPQIALADSLSRAIGGSGLG
jgi:3-methylcrotonyl-CoA carboxylase beta subunit